MKWQKHLDGAYNKGLGTGILATLAAVIVVNGIGYIVKYVNDEKKQLQQQVIDDPEIDTPMFD